MTPATQRAIDLERVARFAARAERLLDDATAIQPVLDGLSDAHLKGAGFAGDAIRESLLGPTMTMGGLRSIVAALRDVVGEIEPQVAR